MDVREKSPNGKRLIDAYKLEDLVQSSSTRYRHMDDIIAAIAGQPAVDAVEVVRCKDCKHWLKDVAGCTDFVGRCEFANYMVGATGYCSYGERKDSDD